MNLLIEGADIPVHSAIDGSKDTLYKCCILVHADNTAELIIDKSPAGVFQFNHAIERYPVLPLDVSKMSYTSRLLFDSLIKCNKGYLWKQEDDKNES